MRVGFIGLGAMGSAMARNLLKAGHELTVYNRTRARAEQMARDGAKVAASPVETASGEVVITMLADDHAVKDVLLGSGNLLSKLRPDQVHISMSTISVELARNLMEAHHGQGTGFVSAPVFGRPEVAAAAQLFVIAAGPKSAVAKCEPLFAAMGQKTFMAGEDPPVANVMKLCGNFLIMANIEAIGEAFALVRKHGIDAQQYVEILTNSFFTAPFQKSYSGIVAQEKYEPAGFGLKLGLKDVRLILAAADAANVPMPITSLLHDRYLTGVSRGMGGKDWSAIARLAAEDAGLK
jgi:3-hydroxyisobutyrate dehydrogenase-like beta-hydroxyacid dehydrogenase